MNHMDRLETDIYNDIMNMRAQERKKKEDRENTLQWFKFASIITGYVVGGILVLSLLFSYLRYKFPEYFGISEVVQAKDIKEVPGSFPKINNRPTSQENVVYVNIYTNGKLSDTSVNKHTKEGDTIIDIGNSKEPTIDEKRQAILNDNTLTEEEKKKKLLTLFKASDTTYEGKYAKDTDRARTCSQSVVDSIAQENRVIMSLNNNSIAQAKVESSKLDKFKNNFVLMCTDVMSEEQLKVSLKNFIRDDLYLKNLLEGDAIKNKDSISVLDK